MQDCSTSEQAQAKPNSARPSRISHQKSSIPNVMPQNKNAPNGGVASKINAPKDTLLSHL